MTRAHTASETGGIVTGWIFRILVIMALFGVLLYEAGAVIVAKVSVDQTAGEAASEAGVAYGTAGLARAKREAKRVANRNGARLVDVRRLPGREILEVTLSKEAPVLLIDRIGFLKDFASAEATKRGVIR